MYCKYMGFKSIFYFCSLPLRLDTYKGCNHGCIYCFSQSLNNRPGRFFSEIAAADPEHFAKLMRPLPETGQGDSLVTSCIRRRVPIHLGCLSDPFQPQELRLHVTRQFLTILARHHYPCVISTKSDIVAEPGYLSILEQMPVVVQFSFSTLDDHLAAKLEPNAPLPSKRLRAMERLASGGRRTVVRLQPFLHPLEQLTDTSFRTFAAAGAGHVILEHLRLPTNSRYQSRARLARVLGYDVLDAYRRIGLKHSRVSYELDSANKLPNVLLARQLAHSNGMTFGSGDNDFHHFSDHLCCCGIPAEGDFAGLYSGHLGQAVFHALRHGTLDFSYIANDWQPSGSIREYINSDCRLRNVRVVRDLLVDRINKPASSNSPTTFYGVYYAEGHYCMSQEVTHLFGQGGIYNDQLDY